MINILGFVDNSSWKEMDAVYYYRCYLPLREIHRSSTDISTMVINRSQVEGMTDDELGGRDIYAYPRVSHGDCEGFIAEIHRRGGLLVIDSDDDLTEEYRLVSGRGPQFKKLLSLADYVTCSTEDLAAIFAQYTQHPPVVLKNQVDTDWMAELAGKSKRLIPGLTIGFSGSPTHWGDWYIPAVPLAKIAREFKNRNVVPILHGETPRYLDHAAHEIMKFGGVPFSIYPVILRQFDIVLCAADPDDQFNSGKSDVKALECMAVGAVPICSRFRPYVELAQAGAPVVLVEENTRDAWYAAMEDLILDEERRKALRAAGSSWVKSHRDMVVSGWEHWAEFYRGIVR